MSHTTTDVPSQQTGTANLTESERHRLLADERRRLALDVLAERATPVELADLADEIAAREDGLDAVDEETLGRVRVSLHHNHLPMMDDLGVADYDLASHSVTL